MSARPRAGATAWPARPIVAAPFRRRGLAALVDLLLLAGLLAAFGGFGLLPGDLAPPRVLPLPDHLTDLVLHRGPLLLRWAALAGGLGAAYVVVFYGLLCRTPGDWLAGLALVDAAGEPATPLRALLRTALLLFLLLPLAAGFWWAAADRQRRALYDRAAGTHLVVVGGRSA